MTRYIAFLRKINVGGTNLMKMDELTRIFTAAGFKNARTYIQCGNVIFDSASANEVGLRKKIEKALRKALGYEVTVILRSLREIEAIVKRNPFRKTRTEGDVMLCIVFLADEPQHKPRLPLASKTEKLKLFEVKDRAAFARLSLSRAANRPAGSAFPTTLLRKNSACWGPRGSGRPLINF